MAVMAVRKMDQDRRERAKEQAARERLRQLSLVDRLRRGEGPTHLNGAMRLRAALFVRRQYDQLIKPLGAYSLADIRGHLASRQFSDAVKIHRWMLKKGETEITSELIKRYERAAEPQKKTRIYLKIVEALADLADEDPDDAMIAFVREVGLEERLGSASSALPDVEVDPALRLADLLRDYAAHLADRLDLARLFQRAELLQVGWNPDEGPHAISLMPDAFQPFDRATARHSHWLVDEVPPFPSVRLGSIPFAHLPNATFQVGDGRKSGAAVINVSGSATARWELFLSIAPDAARRTIPCFLRTTSLIVSLEENAISGAGSFDVKPHRDDLFELIAEAGMPRTLLEGGHTVSLHPDDAKALLEGSSFASVYRKPRGSEDGSELPPHCDLPVARITPVSAASIRQWLSDELTMGEASVEPDAALAETPNYYDSTWSRGYSLARLLELSLRDGRLDELFARWLREFEPSVDAFETDWLTKMTDADRSLRARWRTAQVSDRRDPDLNST